MPRARIHQGAEAHIDVGKNNTKQDLHCQFSRDVASFTELPSNHPCKVFLL